MNINFNKLNDALEVLAKLVAAFLCLILLFASLMITYNSLQNLVNFNALQATLDALFVVIVLELCFAIRSFIKRGTINVGTLVNVAVISAVKELVFKLDQMDLPTAGSFGIIFVSLGVLYLLEMIHYEKKR